LFSARGLFPFEDCAKEEVVVVDAESGAIVGISSLFCETRRFERKVSSNCVVVSFRFFFVVRGTVIQVKEFAQSICPPTHFIIPYPKEKKKKTKKENEKKKYTTPRDVTV